MRNETENYAIPDSRSQNRVLRTSLKYFSQQQNIFLSGRTCHKFEGIEPRIWVCTLRRLSGEVGFGENIYSTFVLLLCENQLDWRMKIIDVNIVKWIYRRWWRRRIGDKAEDEIFIEWCYTFNCSWMFSSLSVSDWWSHPVHLSRFCHQGS